MLENRHLVIRGDQTSKILKVRSYLMQAFREHYFARGYFEVLLFFTLILLLPIRGNNLSLY